MARNIAKDQENTIKEWVEQHPDVVNTHPELSMEELEELIEKRIEECKNLKEWPLI